MEDMYSFKKWNMKCVLPNTAIRCVFFVYPFSRGNICEYLSVLWSLIIIGQNLQTEHTSFFNVISKYITHGSRATVKCNVIFKFTLHTLAGVKHMKNMISHFALQCQ